MTAKRGRPTLAAKDLDAAIYAHLTGKSPKRPRNEFERQVMEKTKGRKVDMTSPTQQAAQLAVYLINTDGLTRQAAAEKAGDAFGVHPATVRRYVRASLKGPQVQLTQKKAAWFGRLPPITVPLVLPIALAEEVFGSSSTVEADEEPEGTPDD
jgi:hypothetical protein